MTRVKARAAALGAAGGQGGAAEDALPPLDGGAYTEALTVMLSGLATSTASPAGGDFDMSLTYGFYQRIP